MESSIAQTIESSIIYASRFKSTYQCRDLSHGGDYPFDDKIRNPFSNSDVSRKNNFGINHPSGFVSLVEYRKPDIFSLNLSEAKTSDERINYEAVEINRSLGR